MTSRRFFDGAQSEITSLPLTGYTVSVDLSANTDLTATLSLDVSVVLIRGMMMGVGP